MKKTGFYRKLQFCCVQIREQLNLFIIKTRSTTRILSRIQQMINQSTSLSRYLKCASIRRSISSAARPLIISQPHSSLLKNNYCHLWINNRPITNIIHQKRASLWNQYRMVYSFCTSNKDRGDKTAKQLKVIDVKNGHIIILQDTESQLPYLKEVQIQVFDSNKGQYSQGKYKGVVLKIEHRKSYIGLYRYLSSHDIAHLDTQKRLVDVPSLINVRVTVSGISCKSVTLPKFSKCIINASNQFAYIDTDLSDRSLNPIQTYAEYKASTSNFDNRFIHTGERRRLTSLSLILTACYDLFYGDLLIFQGGIGSGRTKQVQSLMHTFTKNQNHIGIYVNLSKRDCQRFINSMNKNRNSKFLVFNQQSLTNTSSYVLTVKAIQAAKKLSSQGYNVLIAIDGLKQFLVHEWSLLSAINSSLLPISITNELYSTCIDSQRINSKKRGSLTSIVVCDESVLSRTVDIENMQEISMYSNTVKHLLTMNNPIRFPLDFKINHSKKKTTIKINQQESPSAKSQSEEQLRKVGSEMRQYINLLLSQRKEHQIKSRLNLTRDEPWQHYFLLDSKWWVDGIKGFTPTSLSARDHFLLFVKWNIQEELSSQWNQSCIAVFREYEKFIMQKSKLSTDQTEDDRSVEFIYEKLVSNRQFFNQFIVESKLQGLLQPFKKDYLP